MTTTPRRALLALLAVLGLAAAGCGGDDDAGTAAATPTGAAAAATQPAVRGNITVLAASSLTESFNALGAAFTRAHPQAEVTFSFGASSTLVRQITEGAPADVFASADTATMAELTDAGLASGTPRNFATNALAIIVPKGNPAGIIEVADLADPDVAVVMCGPEVPIGTYSAQVFEKAGTTVTPKSLEENVKAVVTKVTLGEADAGIVYTTDVKAAGDAAEGVVIPPDLNVVAAYPIAVTKEADNVETAQAFVAFVAGPAGQTILAGFGFAQP